MRSKNKLSGVLAALVVTAAILAPTTSAQPVITCDPSAVPPPPSSIAASAAKDYELLRACAARDDAATVASAPVAAEPASPAGFDWVSATIGATVAAAFSLMAAVALGPRSRGPRRAARHHPAAG